MAGMKNVRKENFFERLHERGKSITFDHNGIPIIQNPFRNEDNEFIDFSLSLVPEIKSREVSQPRLLIDSQDGVRPSR